MLTCNQKCSLHAFCNACKLLYAAVVFLMCEEVGKASVYQLHAISKCLPLKKTAVPRLELLACYTGIGLSAFVKECVDVEL
jgi:hypothetical protein